VTVGLAIGSLITGRLVSTTGYTAIFPSCGLVVVTLLFAGLAYWSSSIGPYAVAGFLGVSALFMGTVMGVVQVTVQVSAGAGMLGTAAATVQLSRALGASLGTALIGAVLFIAVRATDPEAARLMTAILQRGPEVLREWPEASRALLQSEIAAAFRLAFFAMAAFAALAGLLAWTIPIRRI
jgi:hypothetical protein